MPDDATEELALARRSLELEYGAKMRDLKAQHQRRLHAFEIEKQEWESYRRERAKELADKQEKVRRRVDNQEQKVELGAAQRKELEELRSALKEAERAEREAARRQKELDERLVVAQARLRSARVQAAVATLVLAACAGSAVLWPSRTTSAILAASVAAALVLCLRIGRAA